MLDAEQVKATIVQRIIARCESCNSHHRACVDGQIRGLFYVLGDGSPPPRIDEFNVVEICRSAGIPCDGEEGGIRWPDDWLKEHGFTVDEDGSASHPTLGKGW